MGTRQVVDSIAKSILICCFFGVLCIYQSTARPLSSVDLVPGFLADHGIAIAAPLVEGRASIQETKRSGKNKVKDAAKYLRSFGYVQGDYNVENVTEKGIAKAIKNFQYFAHLPLTGALDDATISQMQKPRCGMKDPVIKFELHERRRKKRYTRQGEEWDFSDDPSRTLTWKLTNTYHAMTKDNIRRIMHFALGKWQAAANINFQEKLTGPADILVTFAPGSHGDPYPFDGRGGTLAHAYYPYKNYDLGGDIHFDADEHFTYGSSEGTNLLWVAVHEAGHSLGLEHSTILDAVMYPWYRGSAASDFDLRPDDIAGIQAIYGARPTTMPTTEPTTIPTTLPATEPTTMPTTMPTTEPTTMPTTEPTTIPTTMPTTEPTTIPTTMPTTEPTTMPTTEPTTKPTTEPTRSPDVKDCMETVDACVIDFTSGWMYLFSGKHFYLVSNRGLRYGPLDYRPYFRELDGDVTAAYMRQNDFSLILFTGSRYHIYKRFQYERSGPVTDFGLPADARVDAALQWQGSSRTSWTAGTKTYLFTGTKYYRYDEVTKKIDNYYPRVISEAWRGLPSQVSAAVTGFQVDGGRKETYFVAGKFYYIFDDEVIKVKYGYPKHIKEWLKCYSKEQSFPGAIGSLFAFDDSKEGSAKNP